MLPEIWQSIRHLLVLHLEHNNDEMQISSALQVLHQTLPEADITLLTVKPESSHLQLIKEIGDRAFDAAIIFTAPFQSPYSLAYLCYLAGIPIRLGQSNEFGGGVLSSCVKPSLEPVSLEDFYFHLLQSAGFPVIKQPDFNNQPGEAAIA